MKKDLEIASNNSWQTLHFILKKEFSFNEEDYSVYELHLKNKFWEREILLREGCEDLVDDKSLVFSQLVVKNDNWAELLKRLNHWVETLELFSIQLSLFDGLKVTFELKVTEELISSPDKPVLEINISDGKSQISWKAVIDSSCIS